MAPCLPVRHRQAFPPCLTASQPPDSGMANPFEDPLGIGATARKVLEQDRLMRETVRSLGRPDQVTLAIQAMQQRSQIERFVNGFGGVEGMRAYMSTASAAQRAFADAFPPDRLEELQRGFAEQAVLASAVGQDLALLAQTVGSRPDVFGRLKAIPDLTALTSAAGLIRSEDLAAAVVAGTRLDVEWASIALPTVSIGALAELSGFTARVRSAPLDDEARVVEIGEQFGGYDEAFASAEAAPTEGEREAVYTASGRNATLVAFPSRAYPTILVAAGWVSDFEPPPPPMLATGAPCDTAFHDPADGVTITAVEAHLRHFVDRMLTLKAGADWVRTLVPRDRSDAWRQRQEASVTKGNPALAPIYYADFQDLLDIIGRKDLWRDVFSAVFGPKPLFEATMTRLHAIRLELAHSRPLTNTARLRLEVEANAVFTALGVLRT